MDPIDGFYQAMDSKDLLDKHSSVLIADARETLAATPGARVAGMITQPDSPDAPALRGIMARHTGRVPSPGLMVGLVPREWVEQFLTAGIGTEPWLEQGWQPQTVLPVIVSTRDGHRFGFFPITGRAGPATAM